jgi:PilZ domain
MVRPLMFERRQTPRHAVRLLVRHQSDGEHSPVVDYASDLSHGGLFIQTSRAVHQNETLQVEFAPLRDARLVVAFCRVARVTANGIGAEFVQLDDDSKDALTIALSTVDAAMFGQQTGPARYARA